MKITNLARALKLRVILLKQIDHYTEAEAFMLMAIYVMGRQALRCFCNILQAYLSKPHRTTCKQQLILVLRKLRKDDQVKDYGNGPGKRTIITEHGKYYLAELERKLKAVRI